jgi:hypothetical protein
MNSVLEKFRNSKLELDRNFNLLKASVTLFKNNRRSRFDKITLVSSEKRIGEEFMFNARGQMINVNQE